MGFLGGIGGIRLCPVPNGELPDLFSSDSKGP